MTVQAAVAPEKSAGSSQGRRLLHTMIRVRDLKKSLHFYSGLLGMKVLRQKDFETGRFTLAFVGYGDEAAHTVIELTHNWDQTAPDSYQLGSAFGHLAIGVPDIYRKCDELRAKGVKVVREPGPMKHGSTEIAFIEDPNGYRIELIQRS